MIAIVCAAHSCLMDDISDLKIPDNQQVRWVSVNYACLRAPKTDFLFSMHADMVRRMRHARRDAGFADWQTLKTFSPIFSGGVDIVWPYLPSKRNGTTGSSSLYAVLTLLQMGFDQIITTGLRLDNRYASFRPAWIYSYRNNEFGFAQRVSFCGPGEPPWL